MEKRGVGGSTCHKKRDSYTLRRERRWVGGGKRRGPKGPKRRNLPKGAPPEILFISRTDLNYLLKWQRGSLIHSPRRIWRLDEEGNKYALGTKPKTGIVKNSYKPPTKIFSNKSDTTSAFKSTTAYQHCPSTLASSYSSSYSFLATRSSSVRVQRMEALFNN